jgi:hypothetical protein
MGGAWVFRAIRQRPTTIMKGLHMNTSRNLAIAMLMGLASGVAVAQAAADHDQHHPQQAPQSTPAQPQAATPDQALSAMDRQLHHMREMSRKMAEARTPQERQALMAEHHQAMQDGMKMMGQMQGMGMRGGAGQADGSQMMGGMMQRHAMMEKRMEMMQAMLQMMLDRMPAPASQ